MRRLRGPNRPEGGAESPCIGGFRRYKAASFRNLRNWRSLSWRGAEGYPAVEAA